MGAIMVRSFNVVIEKDEEGYFVGSVPSLPGCHTQARSESELMERMREAIDVYLDEEPDVAESMEFVGVQQICVTR
jgi:predicted RNase H-like HicB family nuclease